MSTAESGSDQPRSGDSPNFSLVLGGPLFQLSQRTRLSGDALQLVHRRVIVLTLLAWAPLFLLSIAEGHAWGGSVALPFFHDIAVHARLLIALPLLVLAELVVHQRMRPVVTEFAERRLIPDAARATFDAAIASALHLRNSITAELTKHAGYSTTANEGCTPLDHSYLHDGDPVHRRSTGPDIEPEHSSLDESDCLSPIWFTRGSSARSHRNADSQ